MAFIKSFINLLSIIGAANAFTGFAIPNDPNIHPCSPVNTTCSTATLRAAIPANVPNGLPACCTVVHIAYQGTNIDAIFTDLCDDCAPMNISLNAAAFELLAPVSGGPISPVVWNLEG